MGFRGFFGGVGGLGVTGLIAPGLVVVQDLTYLLNPVHAHILSLFISLSKYSNIFGHYGRTYMEFEIGPIILRWETGEGKV